MAHLQLLGLTMGMFDHLRCELPLPIQLPDAAAIEFQTKDVNNNLDRITIRADGSLWIVPFMDPDDDAKPPPPKPMDDFLGRIFFYEYTDEQRWLEFSVDVVYGRVTKGPFLVRDTTP